MALQVLFRLGASSVTGGFHGLMAFWAGGAGPGAAAVVVVPPAAPLPEAGGVGRRPGGPYGRAFGEGRRREPVRSIYLPIEREEPDLPPPEPGREQQTENERQALSLKPSPLLLIMDLPQGPVMIGMVDFAAQAAIDLRAAQNADDEAAIIAILAAAL